MNPLNIYTEEEKEGRVTITGLKHLSLFNVGQNYPRNLAMKKRLDRGAAL